MTDWYYHDPVEGRVGPIASDEVRARYRGRRIRHDTLAWRQGAGEWQPLDRFAAELGLDAIIPDPSQPPPLPAATMAAPHRAAAAVPARRKGMHGCLIALIVCAVVAVPLAGILAAIAIPAYNDYLQRAKVMEAIAATAPLQSAVSAHASTQDACPADDSADLADVLAQLAQSPRIAATRVGTLDGGHCAFEVTLRGIGPQADGRTLLFEADDAVLRWDCSGGDLPDRFRPRHCRAQPDHTAAESESAP